MYTFLCGHMCSVHLGTYLGAELLGHIVTLFGFEELPDYFFSV